MSLTATDTTTYTPAPAGNHVAICYGVVDLGTQKNTFDDAKGPKPKVRLLWELHGELKDDGTLFTIGASYTNSLNEKASLRKMLESWRGVAFTAEELKGFHLGKIVGKSCMISIVHEPKKTGGGMRDTIKGIATMPKGIPVPKQVNPTLQFDLDSYSDSVFEALPEYLQKWILESPEGALARMRTSKGTPSGMQAQDPDGVAGGDEIPF